MQKVIVVLPNDLINFLFMTCMHSTCALTLENPIQRRLGREVQLGGAPMTYTGGLVKGRRETAVPTLCLLRSPTGPCSFSDVIHHDVTQL